MPKNHRNYQKTRHIALSGLLLFAGSLMVWLVNSVKTFQCADNGEQDLRPVGDKNAVAWFW